MSAGTAILDPNGFRVDARQVRRADQQGARGQYEKLTETLERLVWHVENHWEDSPPELQEALAELAYRNVGEMSRRKTERSLGERFTALWRATRLVLWMIGRVANRDLEPIERFTRAFNRFNTAVLTRVERKNMELQEEVRASLLGAVGAEDEGQPVTIDQFREWAAKV